MDLDFGYLRQESPRVLYPGRGPFLGNGPIDGDKCADGPFVGQSIFAK